MLKPQNWNDCDLNIKRYIMGFVELLKDNLPQSLAGVYLHGSLAMNSYFPPKSDMDMLAVVFNKLPSDLMHKLNIKIAEYSNGRPIIGDIEFSIITLDTAKKIPAKLPYELHYSEVWHERIINNQIIYGTEQYDTDLFAHIMCVKKRGITLYGLPISDVFGAVSWSDFLYAVLDDFDWITTGENICESPYYCILNICRVLHLLTTGREECLSKYEGGQWAIDNLPTKYTCLIEKALGVYGSDSFTSVDDRKTGGMVWDKISLFEFRDYANQIRSDLTGKTAGFGYTTQS